MPALEAIEHITKAGERWDTLAWAYYGDASLISPIVEANPALNITDTLPSGQLVLIPLLEVAALNATVAQSDLPPWKR